MTKKSQKLTHLRKTPVFFNLSPIYYVTAWLKGVFFSSFDKKTVKQINVYLFHAVFV